MNKLFFSFIVILISIGFAYFYVQPLYVSTKTRHDDFTTLMGIISKANKIEEMIKKTGDTLSSVDLVNRDRFAKFLPETIDPLRFANDLQHLGALNGIVLEDIRLLEVHAKGMNETGDTASTGGTTQNVVNVFTIGRKEELKLAAEEKASVAAATKASFVITSAVAIDGKKYSTTKASFNFDTTREKFNSFLYNLEESLGLINVLSISFAPVQLSPEDLKLKVAPPPVYKYTMSIETYSLK